jgi:hypothetical protein
MDPTLFDTFARALTAPGTRRRVLGGLLAGALGLLGTPEAELAQAHDSRKKCKKIEDRGKRKKCVKKAKQHNAQHANETSPPLGTCPAGTTSCGGTCVGSTCTGGQHFEPSQCRCCIAVSRDTTNCTGADDCCSRMCLPHETELLRNYCGCNLFQMPCEVNENCCSGTCELGSGVCPDGNCCACGPQGTRCTSSSNCCGTMTCQGFTGTDYGTCQ